MKKARFLFIFIIISNCLSSQDVNLKYPYKFKADGNPIITHMRTADPSCHVWKDGKLWLYCSHDLDTATSYGSMDGYHVFSSEDLINWIDYGQVLHSKDVKWGIETGGWMWAPDCAFRNGKYYLYFPHKDKSGKWRIGVAVSNKPQGPFIPEPDYIQGTDGIDPMCFTDDDGQAYLYFGMAKVAKLKENMLELAEEPHTIDYGAANFREGPWMHKRNGIYYFSYTDYKDKDNHGFYSMGSSIYGPFKYKGAVNQVIVGAQDHHSIIEFHGKWYYFYHIGNYKGGDYAHRNICIDYLNYNADGTMQVIKQTKEGITKEGIK